MYTRDERASGRARIQSDTRKLLHYRYLSTGSGKQREFKGRGTSGLCALQTTVDKSPFCISSAMARCCIVSPPYGHVISQKCFHILPLHLSSPPFSSAENYFCLKKMYLTIAALLKKRKNYTVQFFRTFIRTFTPKYIGVIEMLRY